MRTGALILGLFSGLMTFASGMIFMSAGNTINLSPAWIPYGMMFYGGLTTVVCSWAFFSTSKEQLKSGAK